MLDTNGVIQTWNEGCELMKGFTAEEAIGQNFDILFPEFLKEQKLHEKERQLATEKGRYEIENWRKRKNGELFWAFVVLTPVHDEKGNHVGFIKITQDQSEKKKWIDQLNIQIRETNAINKQLDDINNKLLKANAMLEEFAYMSSHDLQAPLRKISVFIDRLKAQLWPQLSDEQKDTFNRTTKSTDRMLTLVQNLLRYSFIDKGIGEKYNIDLNEQLKEVLEDLEIELADSGANCRVDQLPIINGNKQQIQLLFQNLISNSLKYAKSGVKTEIAITATQVKGNEVPGLPATNANSQFHLIEVHDNGIGFEQNYAEKIFKPFTRLESHDNYAGTGVGLSIVKKVVENHQGFVWAESKPQEGATFKIILPVNA